MKIRRDPPDKLFSEFIRAKAQWRCERCGSMPSKQGLHCHHFEKRRKQSTRFDQDGCLSLCFGCHQFFEENKDEEKAFMIHKLGQERFDMLEARARQVGKPDRAAIALYLKEEIRKLEER